MDAIASAWLKHGGDDMLIRNQLRLTFSAALGVAGVLSGCGSSSPKVTTAPDATIQQTAGETASCTAAACPPATMNVNVTGKTDTGLLVGVTNEAVPWTFSGVASETGREVAILLNKIPQGAAIDPPQDGTAANTSVRINWTPAAVATSTDKLQIYARDLTRCKVLEKDDSVCAANKILDKYDVMVAQPSWEIINPDAVQGGGANPSLLGANGVNVKVSDPNCGGVKATTESDIKGSILQTGLKNLTPGGILSMLPGLNGAATQPSGSTQPTSC